MTAPVLAEPRGEAPPAIEAAPLQSPTYSEKDAERARKRRKRRKSTAVALDGETRGALALFLAAHPATATATLLEVGEDWPLVDGGTFAGAAAASRERRAGSAHAPAEGWHASVEQEAHGRWEAWSETEICAWQRNRDERTAEERAGERAAKAAERAAHGLPPQASRTKAEARRAAQAALAAGKPRRPAGTANVGATAAHEARASDAAGAAAAACELAASSEAPTSPATEPTAENTMSNLEEKQTAGGTTSKPTATKKPGPKKKGAKRVAPARSPAPTATRSAPAVTPSGPDQVTVRELERRLGPDGVKELLKIVTTLGTSAVAAPPPVAAIHAAAGAPLDLHDMGAAIGHLVLQTIGQAMVNMLAGAATRTAPPPAWAPPRCSYAQRPPRGRAPLPYQA